MYRKWIKWVGLNSEQISCPDLITPQVSERRKKKFESFSHALTLYRGWLERLHRLVDYCWTELKISPPTITLDSVEQKKEKGWSVISLSLRAFWFVSSIEIYSIEFVVAVAIEDAYNYRWCGNENCSLIGKIFSSYSTDEFVWIVRQCKRMTKKKKIKITPILFWILIRSNHKQTGIEIRCLVLFARCKTQVNQMRCAH